MNLLLLHPDLRSGYRLSRHLHRQSRHEVIAVVQAREEVPGILKRCGSLSDLQVARVRGDRRGAVQFA